MTEIAELLNRFKEFGYWPSQLRRTLIKLIPKPTGGKRPIGLLTALVRLVGEIADQRSACLEGDRSSAITIGLRAGDPPRTLFGGNASCAKRLLGAAMMPLPIRTILRRLMRWSLLKMFGGRD